MTNFDSFSLLHFAYLRKVKADKKKRGFYIPRQGREQSLYGMEFEIRLRNELKKKANQDYVYTDGTAGAKSVERRFAEELDCADEVMIYAKLPRGFSIPTPVGNYSPDWAIVFNEREVKYIYFVAETKGSLESAQLRPIEQSKIGKLFTILSNGRVTYHTVTNYRDLYNIVTK